MNTDGMKLLTAEEWKECQALADDYSFSGDTSKAAKWIMEKAKLGYADAQFSLGLLYQDGREVPRDYEAAAA